MKNFKLIVVLFLSVLLFYSCSEKSKDKLVIGLCMDDYLQERWQKDKEMIVKYIEKEGGEVIVKVAGGDSQKQLEQALNLIQKKVNVLIIVPVNRESACEIVTEAHKANIKVISYDRLIKNCDLDYYISFDNVKVGQLQADYLTKRLPEGNYAIIGGPRFDNNSYLIRQGQIGVLQPLIEKGDINLVYEQFAENWTADVGYAHTEKIIELTNGEIQAILAANDAIASGVVKALKKHDLEGKVLVSGQDADKIACQRIAKGLQTMTVYKPIDKIAYSAAVAALNIARGEQVVNATVTENNGLTLIPTILLTPEVVNKETIKYTVIADGYWTEDDIYK